MRPVVVADSSDLWIRLPFERLGAHLPVIGLKAVASWNVLRCEKIRHQSSGYHEAELRLPPRAFGRLAELFAPFSALQIRRICGQPSALVYTFPIHCIYPRWFPRTPSFYYATDDYSQDYGFDPSRVLHRERSLLHHVRHVFAISEALADLLAKRHGVSRTKFTVVPNGLPDERISESLPERPTLAPAPIPAQFRPLIGVLGGINKRLRLDWVLQAVKALPWSYWAFVGPVGELDAAAESALQELQVHPRCCFTGAQSYNRLFDYAASFDAALIPLNTDGINPTCSPVRFFTQLPYGQPILVTPGCRQMQEYSQSVIECDTAASLISNLKSLASMNFVDGKGPNRWSLAKQSTWQIRAALLKQVIESSVN